MPSPAYPVKYECSGCDRESVVERSDARGLYSDPDSVNAPQVVLEQRGWMQGDVNGGMRFCPDCAVASGIGQSNSH